MSELLPFLVALGDPATSRRDRDRATAALNQALLAEGDRLKARFGNLLQTPDDVSDAIAHVLARASRGTQRFRGERGEASARAWVDTVLRNFLIDLERSREIERNRAEDYDRWLLEQERLAEEARRREREMAELLGRVVGLVERRLASEPDGQKRLRRIRLGLEAIWRPGADTRSQLVQLDEMTGRDLDDPATFVKVRNTLYQHRRRGRVDLSHVLASLVRAGELEPAEALAFAAANRVPWPAEALPEAV